MRILEGLGNSLHAIARRFGDETRRSGSGIPIVIREMVEGTLRNSPAAARGGLERDRNVEGPPCCFADAGRYDSRRFAGRNANISLVRMRGKEAYRAGGRIRVGQNGVNRAADPDALKISVRARVKIRP